MSENLAQCNQASSLYSEKSSRFSIIGNKEILNEKKLAFFCSVKCPGDIILKTYDLAKELRENHTTVVSGFHSPIEQECLRILLKGTQPVIVCPARNIETMRIPSDFKPHMENGRLLILSPFNKKTKRTTAKTAQKRNEFVAKIADSVFIAFAAPGSKTKSFCSDLHKAGKPVFTFDLRENTEIIKYGAKGINNITDLESFQ